MPEFAAVVDEVWVTFVTTVLLLLFNAELRYIPTRRATMIMGTNPTAVANAFLFAFFFFNWNSLLIAHEMNRSRGI